MPRLSLYTHTQGNNYKFFDRAAKEMYQIGGTDLYIHKYLGTNNPVSNDSTLPTYDTLSPTNIQDLLFLENRDKKFDQNIYRLRGHYNVQNLDFDLSQFGLFLTNDIIFVTVHYNQMLEIIGRKLMVGDVFELPHLTDYHPLDNTIPVGLRRYYQITDANWASEGFSPTWYAHLWRIKCEPLTNTESVQDILTSPINTDNYMGNWDPTVNYQPGYTVKYGDKIYTPLQPVPPGVTPPNAEYWTISTEKTLENIVTTYNKNIEINDAVIAEAKKMLPLSGYDNVDLYLIPTFIDRQPAPPIDLIVPSNPAPECCGIVKTINNSDYRYGSAAIRLLPSKTANGLNPFSVVILQMGMISSAVTPSGSGQVFPECGLTISVISDGTITGPYGTADNTYSFADQFVESLVTTIEVPEQSTVIPIQGPIDNKIVPGLVIDATVYSANGTPNYIFPVNTIITTVDTTFSTITVSNPSNATMVAGTQLNISYNFDGTQTRVMDYLADCNPNYHFIRRCTPLSFGYINGYMTGADNTPNGEPARAGTAFPINAAVGDFFLRIDYLPQQLYRFDGNIWIMISQNVRTDTGFTSDDLSQQSLFINNDAVVTTAQGTVIPSRQSLSKVLRVKPD